MAVTINWATKVISVPKADLTLIQSTPTEIREMSIDWFRLQLKDIEDNVDGQVFPDTHRHNSEVSLGGLTYARVVEILDPYTITFEDYQYAVNLTGANSNVGDKVNVNQVSVRSNNSAGLISSPEIQYNTFNGVVTLDVTNGFSGTVYPAGTPLRPVNNLADAKTIAEYRGLNTIELLSGLTITTGQNIDNLTIRSKEWLSLTLQTGVSQDNTVYERVSLYGVTGGFWNILVDCWVYDITNFIGWVRGGSIGSVALGVGDIGAEFGSQTFFDEIVPLYPGTSSTLTMNTNTSVSFTNCKESVILESLVSGSSISCGLQEGSLAIDSTCTGGTIHITGVGTFTNASSLTPDTTGLVNKELVSDAVWDEATSGHQTVGTTGKALTSASSSGDPWSTDLSTYTTVGTAGALMKKASKPKISL